MIKQESNKQISCETNLVYLFFSAETIRQSETRLKVNPPIREKMNQTLLWAFLQTSAIDTISCGHKTVSPQYKLNDFRRAQGGVSSLGLIFPAFFTKARESNISDQLIFQWLQKHLVSMPAEIINSKMRSGIKKGNYANFSIWDLTKATKIHDFFIDKQLCPFSDKDLKGRLIATYVRGKVAQNQPCGQFLTKKIL